MDQTAQEIGFQQQCDRTQVGIIALDGVDIGCLQAITQAHELFIARMFVDRPFQRKGIGTEIMKRLIGEATQLNRTVRRNFKNPGERAEG